jgi:hypothetical protein
LFEIKLKILIAIFVIIVNIHGFHFPEVGGENTTSQGMVCPGLMLPPPGVTVKQSSPVTAQEKKASAFPELLRTRVSVMVLSKFSSVNLKKN